jgi:hypothetical protein
MRQPKNRECFTIHLKAESALAPIKLLGRLESRPAASFIGPIPLKVFLLSRQFVPLSREFDKRRLGVPIFRLGSHPVAFSGSSEALLCAVPHAASHVLKNLLTISNRAPRFGISPARTLAAGA